SAGWREMLALILAVLVLQEPRFIMAAEPGDRMRAELFEVEGGVATPEGRALAQTVLSEAPMNLDDGTPLMVLAGASGGGPMLLIGRADAAVGRHKVCRLTETGGATNNLERAWAWCASFLGEPAVTVDLPALTPPSR